MLFGYLIVRVLLMSARLVPRLPSGASRRFAVLLDSTTALFDQVNFYGSRIGARLLGRRRMDATFDRVIAALHRGLRPRPGRTCSAGCITRCDGIRSSRTS